MLAAPTASQHDQTGTRWRARVLHQWVTSAFRRTGVAKASPHSSGKSRLRAWGLVLGLGLSLLGCAHPAERALEGHWLGAAVENFDYQQLASGTAWAKGVTVDFHGHRVVITMGTEAPRVGSYQLKQIQDRLVTLAVLDSSGEQSEMQVSVDDQDTLRWQLGDGRSLVLLRNGSTARSR